MVAKCRIREQFARVIETEERTLAHILEIKNQKRQYNVTRANISGEKTTSSIDLPRVLIAFAHELFDCQSYL